MKWLIKNIYSHKPLEGLFFNSMGDAHLYIDRMGPVFQREYMPICETGDSKLNRMINEGLRKQDLENILLPRISVDEYVPADPNTDNVVLAFFIKGVPEAILPFKNFCEKSNGVLGVDYGDSDTLVNTSIVYVEMDREKLDMDDIKDLLIQISMIAGLEPDDFTMAFPHTNKKFPYDIKLMKKYFDSRTERQNMLAQRKAEQSAEEKLRSEIERMQTARQEQEEEEQTESLSTAIADLMLVE